ncbi:MAG: hypothetical protein ABJA78_12225 [Ferruginibacter sp.]
MNTRYSLHIVHPAFELLKRSARILHFIAASVIIINAMHQLQYHDADKLLCWSQVFIGADILILVFFNAAAISEAPRLNLIFRLMEAIFLCGIGLTLVSDDHTFLGYCHLVFSAAYFFLFYRERRILRNDSVDISQTGITIPNFIKDAEISWVDVKSIFPRYHSIIIETLRNRKIHFELRRNLKIEELEQIDDFCKKMCVNG